MNRSPKLGIVRSALTARVIVQHLNTPRRNTWSFPPTDEPGIRGHAYWVGKTGFWAHNGQERGCLLKVKWTTSRLCRYRRNG